MKSLVLITDLTRMQQDRVCVAGYLEGDRCIRPIVPYLGLPETWLCEHDQVLIRPWNAVELELFYAKPEPPHTEDVVIDPRHRCLVGTLTLARRHAFLTRVLDPSVEEIFGAEIHADPGHFVLAGEGSRSLGTIRLASIREVVYTRKDGRWHYRVAFTDQSGSPYQLTVTDLAFRLFFDHLRVDQGMSAKQIEGHMLECLRSSDVFLRIGLARGWVKHPEHCYMQITGVYSFPDYLDGGCFADFVSHPNTNQAASSPENLMPGRPCAESQ